MNPTHSEQLVTLRPFLSQSQLGAILEGLSGEEAAYFEGKISEFADLISNMPATYQQNGKDKDAVAYLHYFIGGQDYWVTEKDMDGDGTLQAFGLSSHGQTAKLGYISIAYLTGHHEEFDPDCLPETKHFPCVELDLGFKPQTLRDIKAIQKTTA